jgi:hypothetical protein
MQLYANKSDSFVFTVCLLFVSDTSDTQTSSVHSCQCYKRYTNSQCTQLSVLQAIHKQPVYTVVNVTSDKQTASVHSCQCYKRYTNSQCTQLSVLQAIHKQPVYTVVSVTSDTQTSSVHRPQCSCCTTVITSSAQSVEFDSDICWQNAHVWAADWHFTIWHTGGKTEDTVCSSDCCPCLCVWLCMCVCVCLWLNSDIQQRLWSWTLT